jgi:hypothetical protein
VEEKAGLARCNADRGEQPAKLYRGIKGRNRRDEVMDAEKSRMMLLTISSNGRTTHIE